MPGLSGRARDERGAAMVIVSILVVLCASVALGVAAASMSGTLQTVGDRSRLQALAAAEAGRDALLAQIESAPTACPATRTASGSVGSATYAATASWAATTTTVAGSTCTGDGTIRIVSTGRAPAIRRGRRA